MVDQLLVHCPHPVPLLLLWTERSLLLQYLFLLIFQFLINLRTFARLVAVCLCREGRILLELCGLEVLRVRLMLSLLFASELVGNCTVVL